jgi:GcrA cell cycle regulator
MNAHVDPATMKLGKRWVSPTWLEPMIRTIISLVMQGKSASQIGAEIGKTRNAVIGKTHRMGIGLGMDALNSERRRAAKMESLQRKKEGRPPKTQAERRALYPSAQKAVTERVTKIAIADARHAAAVPRVDPADMRLVTLEDLGFGGVHHCRWVEGDPRESHFYCGNDAQLGSSYCAAHHAICYTGRPARDKAFKADIRKGKAKEFGLPQLLFGSRAHRAPARGEAWS